MKPRAAHDKPRPSAEAARDPRTRATSRTRHAVGNAAQLDHSWSTDDDKDGGDWMAERIEHPTRSASTKEKP